MANHKNTKKAIRTNAKKRLLNRYQAVTSRNLVKKLRGSTDYNEATDLLRTVISKLDRLAKKNIIHKNKAANNKSKLTRFVNKMAPAVAA